MLYHLAYMAAWLILRPALALLGGLRVEGTKNIPASGAVILAPNHASYADPPIIGLVSPRVPWFMTKANLFEMRLLAPLMRLFHAFPVAVSGVDRQALRRSEELLGQGQMLCIFPEGGVSDDGRLQPLKPGLALLALRTGTPIVPVALIRTHEFLSPTRSLPRFARGGVCVRIGRPITCEGLPDGAQRSEQVSWLMAEVETALCRLLPPEQQPAAHLATAP